MNRIKKMTTLFLSVLFTINIVPLSAFATNIDENTVIDFPSIEPGETVSIPIGNTEYIRDLYGNIISIYDLPSFSSKEERDAFIYNIHNPSVILNPYVNTDTRATHGTWDVATQSTSYGEITLWVAYTTSGNSNTGTITYHEAYTQYTGFVLGSTWEESYAHSEITESQKAVYASASGVVSCSILVDGLLEFIRLPVNLEGYAYCVR